MILILYLRTGLLKDCGESRVISTMKTLAESGFIF